MKRAAIYARVSTADKGQDPETQLQPLREYVSRRGFVLAETYVDHGLGRADNRTAYRRLLADAHRRRFEVVLVWRYDRLARSTQALVRALEEFQRLGIDFISYQEQVDTTTPQGEMVFTIMASLAQFESSLISERVKAGMARAKTEGKHVGRPPLDVAVQEEIRALYEQDLSISRISKQLGIAYGTAWNYVQTLTEHEGEAAGQAAS